MSETSSSSADQEEELQAQRRREQAERRKARLKLNEKSRLDFITNRTETLVEKEPELAPPVAPPAAPVDEPPQLVPIDNNNNNKRTSNTLFRMGICTIASILLALNSRMLFPSSSALSRSFLSFVYFAIFVFLERLVAVKRIPSILHDAVWVVFLWITLVDYTFLLGGGSYSLQQSSIMWIVVASFVVEGVFGVVLKLARKIPTQFLSMLGSGPILWMIHNFARMVVVMAFIVIFQNLGGEEFSDLPYWMTQTGGGVIFWAWVCLVVGEDIASFFLS